MTEITFLYRGSGKRTIRHSVPFSSQAGLPQGLRSVGGNTAKDGSVKQQQRADPLSNMTKDRLFSHPGCGMLEYVVE